MAGIVARTVYRVLADILETIDYAKSTLDVELDVTQLTLSINLLISECLDNDWVPVGDEGELLEKLKERGLRFSPDIAFQIGMLEATSFAAFEAYQTYYILKADGHRLLFTGSPVMVCNNASGEAAVVVADLEKYTRVTVALHEAGNILIYDFGFEMERYVLMSVVELGRTNKEAGGGEDEKGV